MPTYRIYVSGNYFVIENVDNSDRIEMHEPKKDVKAWVQDGLLQVKTEFRNKFWNYPTANLVDESDTPWSSEAALTTFIRDNTGFSSAPGGSGAAITQNVANYSALSPGTSLNDLAYVQNSQGTAWLPGTLGGTYYPYGFYLWNGTTWVSDRNAIANQLHLILTDLQETNSFADLWAVSTLING